MNDHKPSALKLIAVEEHFLTPEIRRAWTGAAEVEITAGFHGGELGARLDDLGEGRLQRMDEAGVDVQVLSVTSPGLHNLDERAIALARETNDRVAGVVARWPDRFQGFAALPVAMPAAAARELERCVQELGFRGAMLCGRVGGKHMDDPCFWPLYEKAATLGVPLLIHPQIPAPAVREALYRGLGEVADLALASFGLGWHYEAGLQFVRLVVAGVFERYPELQVILGHWGEMVLFYSERLAALQRAAKLARPFAEYCRRNLYVTASGMFSETYLRRTVEIVGIDRILFSTDYPYQYRPGREARRFVEGLGLDEESRQKFAHGNWDRLTGKPNER